MVDPCLHQIKSPVTLDDFNFVRSFEKANSDIDLAVSMLSSWVNFVG